MLNENKSKRKYKSYMIRAGDHKPSHYMYFTPLYLLQEAYIVPLHKNSIRPSASGSDSFVFSQLSLQLPLERDIFLWLL